MGLTCRDASAGDETPSGCGEQRAEEALSADLSFARSGFC